MTRMRLLGFAASLPPWLGPRPRAQDTIDRPINIYVAGTAGGGIDLYARRARAPHRPPRPGQADRSTCR